MTNIYDVTFRITTDSEGMVSMVLLRTKPVRFPDINPEEFDGKEQE